ncbi:MAG: Ig-like domain-containing protein [Clostridiales bacterium]|nr:Ig-like domain-containing protein [Clostridiales bacterium]
MNKERLNDLLKEMHTCDDTRKEEIKKEIYNAYVKPVLYVCKNVLSDDYDYEQYADDSFTMAFGNVEKNNIELGADFVKMLNIATIYTCSMKLSSSPEYLDWTKSKATNVAGVTEADPDEMIDSAVYSETVKMAIPSMLRELPAQEKICAYAYYFLYMKPSMIAWAVNHAENVIEDKLNSVRSCIMMSIRYYAGSNDKEDLSFTRQIIHDFLVYDSTRTILRGDASADLHPETYTARDHAMTQKSRPKPAQEKKQNLEDTNLLAAAEIINLGGAGGEDDGAPKDENRPSNDVPDRDPSVIDFDEPDDEPQKKKKSTLATNKTLLIVVIALAVTLVVALVVIAFTTPLFKNLFNSSPTVVESIETVQTTINIKVGQTVDYTSYFSVKPLNVTYSTDFKDSGVWYVSSSDSAIAIVNQADGTVTGVAVGETTINVLDKTTVKSATINVVVS